MDAVFSGFLYYVDTVSANGYGFAWNSRANCYYSMIANGMRHTVR